MDNLGYQLAQALAKRGSNDNKGDIGSPTFQKSSITPLSLPQSATSPQALPQSTISPPTLQRSVITTPTLPNASIVHPTLSIPAPPTLPNYIPAPPPLPKSTVAPPTLPKSAVAPPTLPKSTVAPPTLPKSAITLPTLLAYATQLRDQNQEDQPIHNAAEPPDHYPDDPFSSQFENHIGDVCDGDHECNSSNLPLVQSIEMSHDSNDLEEHENWPEPPDNLDQFHCDGQTPDRSMEALNDLPSDASRVIKDDDSWSVMCDQGSKLSIMDETSVDDAVGPPLPNRSFAAGITRVDDKQRSTRSARIRQYSYENISLIKMPSQSDDQKGIQYENVVVSRTSERPITISSLPITEYTNDNKLNHDRRASDYENVTLHWTPPVISKVTTSTQSSQPQDEECDEGTLSGSSTDDQYECPVPQTTGSAIFEEQCGELDDLEDISDDCFYSDDEFDDDYDEDYDDESCQVNGDTMSLISGNKDSDDCDTHNDDPLEAVILDMRDNEKVYVNKLHFLCRVVLMSLRVLQKIPNVSCLPADVQKVIFGKIEVIYNFHSSNVLPALEDIVKHWDDHSDVGQIMRDLVPYMKIYLEYAENFKLVLEQYDYWMQKSISFSTLIHEAQECQELGPLTIRDILQDIACHVPSYQAALRDYLDNQSQNAPDRPHLEGATASLTQTCYELDRALGKDDRMRALKEVQARLEGSASIVKATRELYKEGQIRIIHPRNGKALDRYMFVFNDLLLLCSPKQNSGKHRVVFHENRAKTKVHEGDNLFHQYTFYIQGSKQAIECKCSSKEIKYQWMQLISQGLEKPFWMSTENYEQTTQKSSQEDLIGRVKPELMPLSSAESCSLCDSNMGTMRRKYNCMACGRVVCYKCCKLKTALEYTGNMKVRVCDECYTLIGGREFSQSAMQVTMPDGEGNEVSPPRNRICGYLKISVNKARGWKRHWFVVQDNSVLYCFTDHKSDQQHPGERNMETKTEVWSSLLLKRFSVSCTTQADAVFKNTAFKLFNSRRTYYMQADGPDSAQHWINTIADLCDSVA